MNRTVFLSALLIGTPFVFAYAETPPSPDEIRDEVETHQGACADWPNLTEVRAIVTDAVFFSGPDGRSLAGAELQFSVYVSVENNAESDAPTSELGYVAEIWSAGGVLVETVEGVTPIAGVTRYASADAMVTVATQNLDDLAAGDGALRGVLIFRATADALGDIGECDESDNSSEIRYEFSTAANP